MPLSCCETMCVSLSLILPSFSPIYESKSTVNGTPEQKLSRLTWLVVTPPSKSLLSVPGQVTDANLPSQKGFGVLGHLITYFWHCAPEQRIFIFVCRVRLLIGSISGKVAEIKTREMKKLNHSCITKVSCVKVWESILSWLKHWLL